MFQLKAGVRACLCAWGVVGSALAQTALPPTVVVANRAEQPLTDVLADVAIIDRATLEASGAAGVADVLATLPGIEIARNGGVGNTTSVFIRGAESRFVAVFIDGVRVDSQSTGGATWNAIPLALIDRIEVVRGPAAAVYGSDALAGVVQIFTRRGDGGWRPSVEVGAGSDGLRRVQASVAGRQGDWDAAVAVHGERSDGFNVQPAANPDRDGYRSHGVSASVGWAVANGHRLEATVVEQRLKAEYDGFRSTVQDWSVHDLRTVGLRWSAQWSSEQRSELSLGRGTDRYETRPSPYVTETDVTTALWRHEWLLGAHRWQVLLERREDDLRNSSLAGGRGQRHQSGVGLGWGWQAGAHAVQLNVRHDDDSEFGGETTGSAAYAWRFAPGWKARAGVGTAFRAPTLYQRFSEYGSAGLQPERARNAEVALEYARDGWQAGLVAYHARVRDLIQFGAAGPCASAYGCYENVGRARLRGVSLRGGMPVAGGRVEASVDWSDPENAATGKRLARRAARSAKLQWTQPLATGRLGLEWQVAGERFDNAANTTRLGGYGVVNLSWRQPVARDWALLARIDNLGDKAYETARGYATGGRQVYVGLSWTPR
ncbi:Vitamin B12 transporter BtuB [Tepidimonas taiwanensis]|uniref:Vitamin B12 transporter BtuB n=1 Tax=Tepidimonas taiwanensis TaxID=307486 RepID=A0A554XD80_9BURK|nr:TonB-dependent receptor [Tepidimonas taiwanensis]TSE33802.1 Vitamin B12 transporter BtuB [Tepidimonas taiwanensis]